MMLNLPRLPPLFGNHLAISLTGSVMAVLGHIPSS